MCEKAVSLVRRRESAGSGAEDKKRGWTHKLSLLVEPPAVLAEPDLVHHLVVDLGRQAVEGVDVRRPAAEPFGAHEGGDAPCRAVLAQAVDDKARARLEEGDEEDDELEDGREGKEREREGREAEDREGRARDEDERLVEQRPKPVDGHRQLMP